MEKLNKPQTNTMMKSMDQKVFFQGRKDVSKSQMKKKERMIS